MKIVIPMSGYGERFRRAGYAVPKPLIEVDGKPIIAHVVDMFEGEHEFILICNRAHLENPIYAMHKILQRYCPTGKILTVEPHALGPVYAVLEAFKQLSLDEDEPVIVNYCDFTCDWNYGHFKAWINQVDCDGCIPAYRGFHPHSLGSTYYAYLQENKKFVTDIQEKQPFTQFPMQEFASSGTYYFSKIQYLLKYFQEVITRHLHVNEEYYVSMVYKPMIEDGYKISVYELPHFMQWGTPVDLEEYKNWSSLFVSQMAQLFPKKTQTGCLVIPLVGEGSRFAREGYSLPKPLIPVSGLPMVIQAVRDLPKLSNLIFVLRQDLPYFDVLIKVLRQYYPMATLKVLDQITEGQALTCLQAAEMQDSNQMLVIGACDNGVLYDEARYQALLSEPDTDVVVWVKRGHVPAKRYPSMYGWVNVMPNGNLIKSVSVKKPLEHPDTDPIVIGTFTFKRAADYLAAVKRMVERQARVNQEYYVDECVNDAIALGLKCRIFEVDHYLSWGTPNELLTFEYWQGCFHYWQSHPYRLEKDQDVALEALPDLLSRYCPFVPKMPMEHVNET